MATRRYSIGPNEPVESVVEAVGAATATKSIELTVDLGNIKGTGNPTQQITRAELFLALEKFQDWIQKGLWPPA